MNKPPKIVDLTWSRNCLFVHLSESATLCPAVENEKGDFVVLKQCEGESRVYCLDFTDIESSRTLQFGQWTFVDSATYFALDFDDSFAKKLQTKKSIFKIASERYVFDAEFEVGEKFGRERIVLDLKQCEGIPETLGEKVPAGISRFFIHVGISILKFVYAIMKLAPTKDKYLFISKLSVVPPSDIVFLSEYVRKASPSSKVVVLARPMHPYIKYIPHMFRQMWHLATSKAVFLDRSCLVVHLLVHKKSLRVVQMWHAIGAMKRFGCANVDTKEGQPHQLTDLFHMHRGYTDILISSKKFEDDFVEGFGLTEAESKEKMHEIPLPRCDFLRDEERVSKIREEIFEKHPKLKGKKNILYAPTYRMSDEAKSRAASGFRDLLDAIDGDVYNIVYSPHPLSRSNLADNKIIEIKRTTLELLCVSDLVISDYSTIIYEAGLRGLPIYLYGFDYDNYLADRDLNIDVRDEIPLPFYENATDLARSIESGEFDSDVCKKFIDDYVHLPKDKSCCEAIFDLVKGE